MLTRTHKDTQSISYMLDTQEEMKTQSIHDKCGQLVSRADRRIKAIDVDMDQKTPNRNLTRWMHRKR